MRRAAGSPALRVARRAVSATRIAADCQRLFIDGTHGNFLEELQTGRQVNRSLSWPVIGPVTTPYVFRLMHGFEAGDLCSTRRQIRGG